MGESSSILLPSLLEAMGRQGQPGLSSGASGHGRVISSLARRRCVVGREPAPALGSAILALARINYHRRRRERVAGHRRAHTPTSSSRTRSRQAGLGPVLRARPLCRPADRLLHPRRAAAHAPPSAAGCLGRDVDAPERPGRPLAVVGRCRAGRGRQAVVDRPELRRRALARGVGRRVGGQGVGGRDRRAGGDSARTGDRLSGGKSASTTRAAGGSRPEALRAGLDDRVDEERVGLCSDG